MIYLKLAWKNIWRNKRRSFITIASILFAVFFAIFMRSMQLGMYAKMIDSVVRSYYGYIQIHSKGYWDEQSLDNSMENNDETIKGISKLDKIKTVVPRLEGFALLSSGEQIRGINFCGIDPKNENGLSNLKHKIVSGSYINKNDNSVIIAQELAKRLNIKAGDTISLIGQGYHAVSSSGKYHVKGIVKLNSTQMNSSFVFAPLALVQEFYGTGNRITSLAILINEGANAKTIAGNLNNSIDISTLEVMNWEELLPELVQIIKADSSGGEIMVFILYMVISFGIFGTILMMIAERKYEFGVLLSIGMSRMRLIYVLLFESVFITLIGVIAGIFISRPFMYYFNQNPITLTGKAADTLRKFGFEPEMPTLLDFSIPFTHGTAVLSIALVLSLYSVFSILKLNPITASKR